MYSTHSPRSRALVAATITLTALVATGCDMSVSELTQRFGSSPELQLIVSTRSQSGPTEAQLETLRNCESHGNYQAVSRSGTYRGAYQFSQSAWNRTVGKSLSYYRNFDPADASPVIQDTAARLLWQSDGPDAWPHCGDIAA